jgi:hypothetical protein
LWSGGLCPHKRDCVGRASNTGWAGAKRSGPGEQQSKSAHAGAKRLGPDTADHRPQHHDIAHTKSAGQHTRNKRNVDGHRYWGIDGQRRLNGQWWIDGNRRRLDGSWRRFDELRYVGRHNASHDAPSRGPSSRGASQGPPYHPPRYRYERIDGHKWFDGNHRHQHDAWQLLYQHHASPRWRDASLALSSDGWSHAPAVRS